MSNKENHPLNLWQKRQAALLYHFSSIVCEDFWTTKKMRAKESYDIANVRGALTGMSHLLPYWPPPEEQEPTSELVSNGSAVAANLDTTINHTWTDIDMSWAWEQHQYALPAVRVYWRFRRHARPERDTQQRRAGVHDSRWT